MLAIRLQGSSALVCRPTITAPAGRRHCLQNSSSEAAEQAAEFFDGAMVHFADCLGRAVQLCGYAGESERLQIVQANGG